MKLAHAALSLSLLAGCAHTPAVGVMHMGAPHPARRADCKLEFVSIGAADMAPGARFGAGGQLEMIGAIQIGADEGTDALSEGIRQLVRPRACRMGGYVVSLLASGSDPYYGQFRAQQSMVFTVWGKRFAPSSQPQPL